MKIHYFTSVIILLISNFLVVSCGRNNGFIEDRVVVSAFDNVLFWDSLSARIPDALSIKDSSFMAERLISSWIREQVLLAQAERSLSEFDLTFEEAITSYRNALIISHFESSFVASRLDKDVKDEEIEKFHSNHPELFRLQDHVVRALFIYLPETETNLDSARVWLTKPDSISIPLLEQWCVERRANFALDTEYWWYLGDLLHQIPMQLYRVQDQLKDRRLIEFQVNETHYMLRLLEHRFKDLPAPIEIARERIVDLIIQERKRQLLDELRDDLVKEAWSLGEIERNNIPS